MPVKIYGIYLAYPPTVDLRSEGLGRQLAEFLRAAGDCRDTRFVIACPSWMVENLERLLETAEVDPEGFEIIAPRRKPWLLSLHQRYLAYRSRPRRQGRLAAGFERLLRAASPLGRRAGKRLVSTRSAILAVLLSILAMPVLLAGFLVQRIRWLWMLLGVGLKVAKRRLPVHPQFHRHFSKLRELVDNPKHDHLIVRLYRLMEEVEAGLMRDLIARRRDIRAWYSPTAFWPHFNDIDAPRLMCVPDVVLADFPVGFAADGGSRFLDNFRRLNLAIAGARHFVTYSAEVKWRTLVERYHADPDSVAVIPHGANCLDKLVSVSGFADNEAATDALCRSLFRVALGKAVGDCNAPYFGGGEIRFIFYASQFRSSKNIVSLLRAYDYLLKRRHLGHKLVLTGHPGVLPAVAQFIAEHHLENDILCLHGLAANELAACYRLADLAVNPSLSEGGCPFTFTEAMSVGTPVVMSRIAVTEEVITSPELQELMLFDPYDWMDMASRIEWALKHRDLLFEKQKPCYERLLERTWRQVVEEHVAVLDRISSPEAATP